MIAVGAVGVTGLGYAWLEARAFVLRQYTLPVLPPGSPSVKVLHVSDLHLVPRQRRKASWVHQLGILDPDLIVSTGDTIAARDAVPGALQTQETLLRYPGVFVLGSNDYYEPRPKNPARYLLPNGGRRHPLGRRLPTEDLVAGYLDAGWLDLGNRRGTLTVNGLRLDFVGVDDAHLGRDRYDLVSRPADPDAALTIGVTHAPYVRVLDAMAADGAGLLLAGHTHGGQLCLPGVGTLVTNCDLSRRQARGVSRWQRSPAPVGARRSRRPARPSRDDAWLHVSAGLGTSPYTPVRFACRPEASLLTLVADPMPAADGHPPRRRRLPRKSPIQARRQHADPEG
jgi:predicted MPP superfamily phosphohydrolase